MNTLKQPSHLAMQEFNAASYSFFGDLNDGDEVLGGSLEVSAWR